MTQPCKLWCVGAVVLAAACAAYADQDTGAPRAAIAESAAPADAGVQAASTDMQATEAAKRKYSRNCKGKAPVGTRVARRTCVHTSNDEATRRATENAMDTMHEARQTYND
jgi:hypothetical protein